MLACWVLKALNGLDLQLGAKKIACFIVAVPAAWWNEDCWLEPHRSLNWNGNTALAKVWPLILLESLLWLFFFFFNIELSVRKWERLSKMRKTCWVCPGSNTFNKNDKDNDAGQVLFFLSSSVTPPAAINIVALLQAVSTLFSRLVCGTYKSERAEHPIAEMAAVFLARTMQIHKARMMAFLII